MRIFALITKPVRYLLKPFLIILLIWLASVSVLSYFILKTFLEQKYIGKEKASQLKLIKITKSVEEFYNRFWDEVIEGNDSSRFDL